jgi:hypothetical protein
MAEVPCPAKTVKIYNPENKRELTAGLTHAGKSPRLSASKNKN